MIKQRLFTPGPTDVPPEVLIEMAKPIFHHRTQQFKDLFAAVNDGLKKLLFTKNDVLTLAGSGTAAMEAAIACACPRNKKLLVANCGKFGERWVKVGKVYGLDTEDVQIEWGKAITAAQVAEKLKTGQYGAVVVVHSETSTATATDIKAVAAEVARTDALLLVDAITSAGTLPLKMDEWGIDIIGIGSQKALMLPPGLGLVAVSEKAWKVIDTIKSPTFYLNLKAYRKSLTDSDVPYTPAVTLIRGLKVALDMIHAVGIEKVWARTAALAKASRQAATALVLKLVSQMPSDSVTGMFYPAGVTDKDFRKALRTKYGCNVAGGQGDWEGTVFRISHMGYVDPLDTIGLFAAIEYVLAEQGVKVELGKGVAEAVRVLRDWK
jgi:aspartate aminotransferase-like enzyme